MKTQLITRLMMAACLAAGLSAAAQARNLSEQDKSQIHVGMTQSEVQQVLGKPDHIAGYALNKETAWQYELDDQIARPGDKIFEVTYENGVVASSGDRYIQED
jgi:outer membrane protein assembly factor BamE (lipoprotein component of BamABCDE complex)